jgi:hypothetical protein
MDDAWFEIFDHSSDHHRPSHHYHTRCWDHPAVDGDQRHELHCIRRRMVREPAHCRNPVSIPPNHQHLYPELYWPRRHRSGISNRDGREFLLLHLIHLLIYHPPRLRCPLGCHLPIHHAPDGTVCSPHGPASNPGTQTPPKPSMSTKQPMWQQVAQPAGPRLTCLDQI